MQAHEGAKIRFQPRIRKGAFFDASWRYGCRNFSVYNRTYISSTFSDPLEEYWHVINHVALWPVMGERQVEIAGPDAARFTQYLTPRNLDKCAVGQCKYALITAGDGGIVCDPILLRPDKNRFWLSTSDCDLELWTRAVADHADMDVTVRDADVSVIQVQGPKSPGLMVNLVGEDILDLKYYWLMRAPFEGTELIVSRTGWSGEFGYEIYLDTPELGDRLFDALMEAGKPFNVAPGAVNHVRRIESGIQSWGLDMTLQHTPYEVGLGRLVDLAMPHPFVGRAALERLKDQPLTKSLVGLVVEGDALRPNEDIWPVYSDGAEVGRLTSLAYSPRLERNIALATVDAALSATETALQVETWDGLRGATVAPMPFLPKRQSTDARSLYAELCG